MVVEEAKGGGEGREWEGVVQDQARLFLATVARAQEGDAMPVRDAARPQHGPPGVGGNPAHGGEGEHHCILSETAAMSPTVVSALVFVIIYR